MSPLFTAFCRKKTALRKSDERDITGALYDITTGGFSEVIHAAASEKARSWALRVTDTSYCWRTLVKWISHSVVPVNVNEAAWYQCPLLVSLCHCGLLLFSRAWFRKHEASNPIKKMQWPSFWCIWRFGLNRRFAKKKKCCNLQRCFDHLSCFTATLNGAFTAP